jgi:hypothetical protein
MSNATKEEMKQYARDELGISLPLTMNETTMRQKISDRMQQMGIVAPTSADVQGAKGDATKAGKRTGYVTIVVAKSQDKGGGQPAFVGVNAKGYTIPRGVPIAVPNFVELALRYAIQTIYEYDEETLQLTSRDVPTYSYNVVGGHENLLEQDRAVA